MASFTFEKEIAAPPATVFEVVTDHAGYQDITSVRSAVVERQGDPPPNGVGAIRALTTLGPPLREEVVEYRPNERFAYKVISGAPLRDHLGTVDLSEAARSTRLVYTVTATPTLPVVGFLVSWIVKASVRRLIKGVTREAERRAAAEGRPQAPLPG